MIAPYVPEITGFFDRWRATPNRKMERVKGIEQASFCYLISKR
jgi:hypothetical protein